MQSQANTKRSDLTVFKSWKKIDNLGQPIFNFTNYRFSNPPNYLTIFQKLRPKKSPYFKKGIRSRIKIAKQINESTIFPKKQNIKGNVLHYLPKKGKKIIDPESFCNLSFSQLESFALKSYIFSQLNVDHPGLNRLGNSLSKTYKCYVGINGYFTPKKSQTLPLHFDNHDVFIFQVSGKKHWRVYDCDINTSSELKPIIEVILEPGDFLFIPAGFYHEANTNQKSSFHLTFGIHEVAILRLKKWMQINFPKIENWSESKKSIYNYSLLYYLKNNDIFSRLKWSFLFENRKIKQITILNSQQQVLLPLSKKKSLIRILKGNSPHSVFEKKLSKLIEVQ